MKPQAPLLLALAALLLAGCGGSAIEWHWEPKPLEPVDLTGWWLVEHEIDRDSGALEAQGLLFIEDWGDRARFDGIEAERGLRVMTAVWPSADDPSRSQYILLASESEMGGTREDHVDGHYEGTYRVVMTRVAAPAGSLAVNGEFRGRTITVDSSTAHAQVVTETGAGVHVDINDLRGDGHTALRLSFPDGSPIEARVWDFGPGPDEVTGGIDVDGEIEPIADAISNVVITASTPERLAGWYVVELGTGETVAGTFDVDILVDRVAD